MHPTSTPRSLRYAALPALLALAVALALPAHAADSLAEAKDHFQKGQTHYSLGDFAEAVAEFREAYRLSNAPAILFNLGQSMRQVGDYKKAYFYYSQYLSRKPDAPNRGEVESFMSTMKKKIDADEEAEKSRAQADAARPAPPRYPEDRLEGTDEAPAARPATTAKVEKSDKSKPHGPKASEKDRQLAAAKAGGKATDKTLEKPVAATAPGGPATTVAPPEAVREAPHAADEGVKVTKLAGYTAMGVGVAAAGLAFVFHGSAQSAADEFNTKYSNGTLTPADAHLRDDANAKGGLATMSLVGAGVLLVSGAVLAFVF